MNSRWLEIGGENMKGLKIFNILSNLFWAALEGFRLYQSCMDGELISAVFHAAFASAFCVLLLVWIFAVR